jgi:ABC-type uncharacterized transport system permease subunit
MAIPITFWAGAIVGIIAALIVAMLKMWLDRRS